jgi:putative ABC transport system permease protein
VPVIRYLLGTVRLAFRNVLRQRVRTGMTIAAIVFGVVGIILSGGFVHDVLAQLGEALIHSQSGHLQVAKRGYFGAGSRKPEEYAILDPDTLKKPLAAVPGMEDVMARLSFSGLLTNGRSDLPIIGEGIEPGKETRLGTFLILSSGRQLNDGDRYGILIGKGVAHALKLAPGDRASIVLNTAGGAMNTLDFEVVGVFQTFSKDYDARAVRIPIAAAQELLDTQGVNVLVASLKRTRDTDWVAQSAAAVLGTGELEIKRWEELNDFYPKTVELYDRQFGVLQLIVLAMVILTVTNTVNMTVFERAGEFGTMRALGNRGRDIFLLVVTENALLGVAGAVLGTVLGIWIASIISAIGIPMPPPPNADVGYTARVRIVADVVGSGFAVGVLATLAASILPALRVARGSVVEALRQNV